MSFITSSLPAVVIALFSMTSEAQMYPLMGQVRQGPIEDVESVVDMNSLPSFFVSIDEQGCMIYEANDPQFELRCQMSDEIITRGQVSQGVRVENQIELDFRDEQHLLRGREVSVARTDYIRIAQVVVNQITDRALRASGLSSLRAMTTSLPRQVAITIWIPEQTTQSTRTTVENAFGPSVRQEFTVRWNAGFIPQLPSGSPRFFGPQLWVQLGSVGLDHQELFEEEAGPMFHLQNGDWVQD